MENMKNKIALVTGAAQGIGLACAEAFAKAGATVVVSDINNTEEQAQKIIDAGFSAVSYKCDVSDAKAVDGMVDWIVRKFGRLDAAVNNAGIQTEGQLVKQLVVFIFIKCKAAGALSICRHKAALPDLPGRLPTSAASMQ